VVRVAKLSAEPALVDQARRLLDDYLRLPDAWPGPVPEELPEPLRAILDAFPGAARPPTGDVLVAIGEHPVGAVHVVRHDPATARLERMFVREDARRCGVGRELLSAAVGAARSLGYHRLVLDVIAERADATNLYLQHGFTTIAAYADYARPMTFLGLDLQAG